MSNYFKMYVTGQTAIEYTSDVKLLQNVYVIGQTTAKCTLHVKQLQNVHYMSNYYRTYNTYLTTIELT